jgi:hypothetical protein
MTGAVICLVNRSPWPLLVTKDGRQTRLEPGDNYVNADIVRFAKQQHPIPGTQDPYNPYVCQFLVGVKGTNDPIDPLPQELLELLPSERIDRTKMPVDKQRTIEKNVPFPRGRVAMEDPTAGILEPGDTFGKSH